MAKRDFIHERYGDMFDKVMKSTETKNFANLGNDNRDILKVQDDTMRQAMIKERFNRKYGKLTDTVPGKGFIEILGKIKDLRKMCLSDDTQNGKSTLRDLDKYFSNVVSRELSDYAFFFIHGENKCTFIFGNESLGREYFKNNPGYRWSLMDYRWFTYFYNRYWRIIDNYSVLDDACGLVFHDKIDDKEVMKEQYNGK